MENSKPEKIAVIAGGTGLIGSALIPMLISNGYRVRLLTRYPERVKVTGNVDVHKWDGKPGSHLNEMLDSTQVVINLTGYNIATLWTKRNRRLITDSRILPTRAIAKAINECANPPKVLIQASAVGIYPCSSNTPLNESSPMGKGFLAGLVENWENEALTCSNTTRVVLIRTGIVLSDRGGFLPKILKPIKLYLGAVFGKGNQVVPWIHIDDHVRAIMFLIEHPSANGAFNLTAPASNTLSEIAGEVAEVLKRPLWFRIPAVILRLLPGNMAAETLLANQPVVPQRLKELGFKWQFDELRSAIRHLINRYTGNNFIP